MGSDPPALRLRYTFDTTMGYENKNKGPDREIQLQKAITIFLEKRFLSVLATARYFKVSPTTMTRRLNGGVSQAEARETQQILTNAEEKTLARWVKRYIIVGTPLSPTLLLELA